MNHLTARQASLGSSLAAIQPLIEPSTSNKQPIKQSQNRIPLTTSSTLNGANVTAGDKRKRTQIQQQQPLADKTARVLATNTANLPQGIVRKTRVISNEVPANNRRSTRNLPNKTTSLVENQILNSLPVAITGASKDIVEKAKPALTAATRTKRPLKSSSSATAGNASSAVIAQAGRQRHHGTSGATRKINVIGDVPVQQLDHGINENDEYAADIQHPVKKIKTSPPTEPSGQNRRAQIEKDMSYAVKADELEELQRKQRLDRISDSQPKQTSTGYVKDFGWQDLDSEDADEPLMVAEYVVEIFDYMRELEVQTAPNCNYMISQTELNWNTRGILVDWLMEVHHKFKLLPETLFLAINLVDRFLSHRCVSLHKIQLVGMTALFIAAKYEEVLCPSVENLLFMSDGEFSDTEILKAEAYILSTLDFDLSYPNPIHFLRRSSKADGYDVSSRTLAKYFMEISCVDHSFIGHAPSVIAAAGIWLARLVLGSGEWNANLVHYSGYSEPELLPTAQLMLDYILRDTVISASSPSPKHEFFFKKYSSKKFLKAATHVQKWAQERYPGGFAGPHSLTDEVKKVWEAQGREWECIPEEVYYRP